MADDDVSLPVLVTVLVSLFGLMALVVFASDLETTAAQEPEPLTLTAVAQSRASQPIAHRLPIPQEQAEPDDDFVNVCRDRHPKDHHLREVCQRTERQARFVATTLWIDNDIGVLCTKRHPSLWSLYVACARQQIEAKLTPDQKPKRPSFNIEEMCALEYPDDLPMREHCERQQDDARDQAGSWIPDAAAKKCAIEWSANWQMFMHCVRRQTGASAPDPEIRKPAIEIGSSEKSRDRSRVLDEIINAPSSRREVHTSSGGVQNY